MTTEWVAMTKTRRVRLAGLLVVTGLAIVGGMILRAQTNDPKRYYKRQLTSIGEAIKAVGPATALSEKDLKDTGKNLDNYDMVMDKITGLCRPLINEGGKYVARTKDKKTLDTIHNSKLLCTDLTDVAGYSQMLYRGARPFVSLQLKLPSVDSADYLKQLDEINTVAQKAKADINGVAANHKVQDPGLAELVGHLDDVSKQVILIKSSLEFKDYDSARQQNDQLRKLIKDDRIHFLSARSYFWSNTVRLDSLRDALSRLTPK